MICISYGMRYGRAAAEHGAGAAAPAARAAPRRDELADSPFCDGTATTTPHHGHGRRRRTDSDSETPANRPRLVPNRLGFLESYTVQQFFFNFEHYLLFVHTPLLVSPRHTEQNSSPQADVATHLGSSCRAHRSTVPAQQYPVALIILPVPAASIGSTLLSEDSPPSSPPPHTPPT